MIRLIMAILAVVTGMQLGATGTSAQTRVTTAGELSQALGRARGGELIELAPGNYGRLSLSGSQAKPRSFTPPVVIRSTDPSNPAVIEGVALRWIENLSFENLALRYVFAAGDDVRIRPFNVRDSKGISFLGSRFIGDLASGTGTAADGFGFGIGLSVTESSQIRIEGNRFENWHRGAVFAQSRDIVVKANSLRGIRSDGFNFAEVVDVLIEANSFAAFRTSLTTGDHPDMIQFWTARTKSPSTDITIKNNIMDIGDGPWTQSIFMRNEEVDNKRADPEMFYRNITIVGNFIRNSHVHGITVGETDGLTIANNTLIQATESPRVLHLLVPGINLKPASRNVRILDNITARLPELQPGWIATGNVKVQRNFPRGQGFFNTVFVDAMAPGAASPASYALLPGAFGTAEPPGSPIFRFNEHPAQPTLLVLSSIVSAGRNGEHKLEVTGYGPTGRLDLSGAKATWDFDDGSQATGPSVTHRFPQPGMHRVKVDVVLRSGERLQAARSVLAE